MAVGMTLSARGSSGQQDEHPVEQQLGGVDPRADVHADDAHPAGVGVRLDAEGDGEGGRLKAEG